MAQQATPTIQANLGGTSTNVHLRDWLNTRLSPFLKKAIIDSLETEAEFPLQWLGEHLIEQSILFEGNPDSTQLRERFRYNHDSAAAAKQTPSQPPIMQTAPSTSTPSAAVLEPAQEPQAIKAEEMDTQPAAIIAQTPISVSTSEQQNGPADTQEPTIVAISNTITTEPPEAKDTEMSNAT